VLSPADWFSLSDLIDLIELGTTGNLCFLPSAAAKVTAPVSAGTVIERSHNVCGGALSAIYSDREYGS
jgi:hypothetical protein